MQATLAARNKLIDAVAPRPAAGRGDGFTSQRSSRNDPFATQFADARDRATRRVEDADSLKPAAVEPARESKASEPARTERREPSQDADSGRGEDRPAEAAAAKVKPAAKREADASDEEDTAETFTEVMKPIETSTAGDAAAADAIATNVQLPVPRTDDATSSNETNDGEPSVDAIAALALAAHVSPTAADFTGETDAAESTDAASKDATAMKLVSSELEAKSGKSQLAKSTAHAETIKPDLTASTATSDDASGREHGAKNDDAQQPPQDDAATATLNLPESAASEKLKTSAESTFDELLATLAPQEAAAPKQSVDRPQATPVPIAPEQKFVADNVDDVVKSVRMQVEAGGGQMRMRLDPPELGALDVAVKMLDGRMTATFTTNNDHATQLLSHSLNDLKHSLEASGITVDRIQVRQASSDNNAQQQPGDHRREGQSGAFDQPSGRGDQQRKEAVEKMWRKLAYGSDELDFIA